MPRKKPEFAEDEKQEKYVEVWDVRKIIAGVVVLLVLLIGGVVTKRIIFHESLSPSSFIPKMPSVKGLQTFNAPDQVSHMKITLPSQGDVVNQVQHIRNQVSNLNVAEIASSSPQVQAVLKQIENLPNAGTNQAKEACVRLCNNL